MAEIVWWPLELRQLALPCSGQKILTQNEPNCRELSRIPANSWQFLTEKLALCVQSSTSAYMLMDELDQPELKHSQAG